MTTCARALAGSALVLLVSLATACGDDTGASPPNGGGGGGVGGSEEGGPGGEGGSGGSDVTGGSGGSSAGGGGAGGSGGDGGSGGTSATRYGYVSLVQSVTTIQGTEYVSHSISAAFVDSAASAGGGSCTISEQGVCTISDCAGETHDGGTPPAVDYSSAGVVRVKAGATTVSMTPEADGSYAVVTGQTRLWSAGQTLDVQADGDEVPAFSGALAGVDPVTVTAPGFPPAGSPMVIERDQDLAVSWSGGSAGKVLVQLARTSTSGATTRSVSALCAFEASAGDGVVPAAVVSAIPAGDSGSFSVYAGDRVTLAEGEWSITLQEYVPAVLSTGYSAAALATFE